ncbi:MAG: MFS transporter [Novosphingobium sp.]|nr:MFS transporter [Novosphingobium sp.]
MQGNPQEQSKIQAARFPLAEPLKVRVFGRIWTASLLSNFGLLIQGVGSAWAMVQLGAPADTIALVQTALMMPVMIVSLAAGALADMFDRRKVGLVALSIALLSASLLSASAFLGLLSPPLILMFCFLIGTGHALFGPAWQASVAEQVPPAILPQAVSLNSISFNIARSFGPAIGGVIVAVAGAAAAFTINAVLYLPIMLALFAWKREVKPTRLPPERIGRAIVSGVRFILYSPPMRVVLARVLALGIAGGSISALMPLVANTLLGGGAQTYGLLLGALGIGSVIGAMSVDRLNSRLGTEGSISICSCLLAVCIAVVAFSPWLVLTLAALIAGGMVWTLAITLFNVSIQLSAPRWVSGRALAGFQAAIAGGIAIGSWFWGVIAESLSVSAALALSAAAIALTAALRVLLRLPDVSARNDDEVRLGEVDVALSLSGRSGPIVVEIDYHVDPSEARAFYRAMQDLQQMRHRNGAYDWSIARNIADPWTWTERFHCPTWHDYLRLRDRNTSEEMEIIEAARAFHRGEGLPPVRRMLERPYGSVRWRDETRDEGLHDIISVPHSPA